MNKDKNTYSKKDFKKEFARLMSRASIPDNLPKMETLLSYAKVLSFVEHHIPSKLFRFRKCNIDTLISIEQGTIPVCIADKFPDKYDSTVFYDNKTLDKRMKEVYNLYMPTMINAYRNNPSSFPINPVTSKIKELIENDLPNDIIETNLWDVYKRYYDDWKEHIEKQQQWARQNKATKLACFTETVTSKFMWDTYADGYTGFALEYDFRNWRVLTKNSHAVCLFPIIYTSQKMDATEIIDRISGRNFMMSNGVDDSVLQQFEQLNPIDRLYWIKTYLYKDKAEYAHEKEWRLIDMEPLTDKDANKEFSSIPDKGCLKAIYYGPEIEERYKEHFRTIAKSKGIKEYDVVLDRNSRKYSLKVVPLR